MTGMTIAGLARTGGVGVETVRYYQRRGLLETPERTGGTGLGGGIRRYGEEDVRRLRFIRGAQVAGFTLEPYARKDAKIEESCRTCMYYSRHREWCWLPSLKLPVKPEWPCRLWRI